MNLISLIFDTETGAKIRAVIVTVLGFAAALLGFLQGTLGVLNTLPAWDKTAAISGFISAAIVALGRLTSFGNKVIGDGE